MIESLSVIVPVYNSEASLSPLCARLEPVLAQVARRYELILVNDGSRDGSWGMIAKLAADRPWVQGINLMRNYGQHNALLCGIRAARYDVVATLDDDLQHPPEALPVLLAKLAEGQDVVYGAPLRERHGLWRDLASQVTKVVLQGAMGAESARRVSAFRVFRTYLRDGFTHYQAPYVSVDVLLSWATTRFAAVRVEHHLRTIGTSNYTFRKLLTHALNMITGFSTLPLQLASVIGFVFTCFGIVVLGYVLLSYAVRGQVVPGFAFLASVIAIFSGAQLFALGMIGEYLARMHFRMMDRPSYVVRARTAPAAAEG